MSTKPKLLRWRKFEGIPPKSTNNLYQKTKNGLWIKTFSYRLFRQAMAALLEKDGFLPSTEKEWKGHGLYIEAGIIKEFDLDNTLKGIIDALQENYDFNDNLIEGIIAKKTPVGSFPLPKHKWSEQYITIGFIKYADTDCNIFDSSDFNAAEHKEVVAGEDLTEILFRSVTEDFTNVKNSDARKTAVYPMSLYPDIEKAAEYLKVCPEILEKEMRSYGAEYKLDEHLIKKFGNSKRNQKSLRENLFNYLKEGDYKIMTARLKNPDFSKK